MDENKEVIKKEVIKTTPEDGFVDEKEINPVDMDNYHKYFKGYATNVVLSTNDPRITRPFVNIMYGIFMVIGILELLFCFIKFSITSIILGLLSIIVSIFGLTNANKDIDEIEREYKKNPNYNEKLTEEEKKQYIDNIKNAIDIVHKENFTRQNYSWFKKQIIVICSIIDVFLFILLSITINIIVGIIVFILLIAIELLYLILVSKLFK